MESKQIETVIKSFEAGIISRRQIMGLAVKVHLEETADHVHELLGVRVVVLADAVAGLDDGQPHEAAGRAHRRWCEHGAQVASTPAVGLCLAEVHDARPVRGHDCFLQARLYGVRQRWASPRAVRDGVQDSVARRSVISCISDCARKRAAS